MISHEHRCIFVHIPKCAGKSIDHAFGHKHDHACHQYPQKYTEWDDPSYFRFTFARNPYDRVLSAYSYMLQFKDEKPCFYFMRDFSDSFERFVMHYVNSIPETPIHKISQHVRPQALWIRDGLDFIGRVENIQRDFDKVRDHLGLPRVKLTHRNRSEHSTTDSYFTGRTRRIIQQIYARDFEVLGYDT